MSQPDAIRQPAEHRYPGELQALAANDTDARPPGWTLSPRAVERFITGTGGEALSWEDSDGTAHETVIRRKFYGHDLLVQRAIVTLASDRGLLLVGEPGTTKSWLSEHLAAAISGTSLLTIQGSAGLTEDQIKYCLLYTSPSPRDKRQSRMPSSA